MAKKPRKKHIMKNTNPDGDCEKCNMKPVCKKSCPAHKKLVNAYLKASMINFLQGKKKEKDEGLLDPEWDELLTEKFGESWGDDIDVFADIAEGMEEDAGDDDGVPDAGAVLSPV